MILLTQYMPDMSENYYSYLFTYMGTYYEYYVGPAKWHHRYFIHEYLFNYQREQ